MVLLLACTPPSLEVPLDSDVVRVETAVPDSGEPDSKLGGESSEIFDSEVMHRLVVTTEPGDWTAIQNDPASERYIRATVQLGDVVAEDVGLRFKGSWGSLFWCADGTLQCDKLNLKLDFHEYETEQRFFGLKKLNLHAMEVDDANMREHLAYTVWRGAGVPAPRTGWTTLAVNGEEMGLFLLVEQVDGRFTRDRWEDGDGDLYKEVWLTETDASGWRQGLVTNRDESPTPARMAEMARDLTTTDGDDFEQALDRWMDREELARFLAAMELTGSFDSVAAFYCGGWGGCENHNFFWYDTGALVRLIPWDMDRSYDVPVPLFESHDVPHWTETAPCEPVTALMGLQVMPPGCDPFLKRLQPVLTDDYLAAIQTLRGGPASLATLTAEVDRLELFLQDAVAADPHGPSIDDWSASVKDLRADLLTLDARYAP